MSIEVRGISESFGDSRILQNIGLRVETGELAAPTRRIRTDAHTETRVLLLDVPFGALNATIRRDLRRWLRRLHDPIHVTATFVTHGKEEA